MINKKSIYTLALAGLISIPGSLSANGVQEGAQVLALGLAMGFSYWVFEDVKEDFVSKEPRKPTTLLDDCTKVAKTCAVVPTVLALLKGQQMGYEALGTSVIGGAAYIATNRLVDRHDLSFWPTVTSVALYSISKGICKNLNIPVLDWQ